MIIRIFSEFSFYYSIDISMLIIKGLIKRGRKLYSKIKRNYTKNTGRSSVAMNNIIYNKKNS